MEKLNSEIIVKTEKTIEQSPKPAAKELRISKRTLAIIELNWGIKIKCRSRFGY
ncbi:hypothetical protein PL9631_770004 [Planktothrix paucivesiculata PCC 9631]|uniref:Uncharacterized protein n=1 Tax=Planktothrix paucivesiculata PCC 9631 TaxID=671071 RepID=A0A7Z9BY90_9CYAN|nr:hypothetical protein PL9631_770004 [Planktothrix paucivesiculata PCC 9631]